jgi:hypothetical protein
MQRDPRPHTPQDLQSITLLYIISCDIRTCMVAAPGRWRNALARRAVTSPAGPNHFGSSTAVLQRNLVAGFLGVTASRSFRTAGVRSTSDRFGLNFWLEASHAEFYTRAAINVVTTERRPPERYGQRFCERVSLSISPLSTSESKITCSPACVPSLVGKSGSSCVTTSQNSMNRQPIMGTYHPRATIDMPI